MAVKYLTEGGTATSHIVDKLKSGGGLIKVILVKFSIYLNALEVQI